MDGAVDTNSAYNSKFNYSDDVNPLDRKKFNQFHIAPKKCTGLNSLDKTKCQNSQENENCKRPNSVNVPAISETIIPNERSFTKSLSVPQNYSLSESLRNINKLLVDQWTSRNNISYQGQSAKETDCVTEHQEGVEQISDLSESTSLSPVKDSIRSVGDENSSFARNSSSFNKIVEDGGITNGVHTASSPSEKGKELQHILKTPFVETVGNKSLSTVKPKEQKIPTTNENKREETKEVTQYEEPSDSKCDATNNHSLKATESSLQNPDKKQDKTGESFEDSSDLDDMWRNYVQRPLLPLKPLQKQRSLSCTNLVQTIIGFSKKKTTTDGRFLPPDNNLFQAREICTSEADIFNKTLRQQSIEAADQNVRRMSDFEGSLVTKDIRQSLQQYTWYHFIDAREASKKLLNMRQNGVFLIRPASNPTSEVLHTLCVAFSGRVYNYHVRSLKNGHITLSKKTEQIKTFQTLLDMIKYHQTAPLTIKIANQVAHVHLLITPPK